jgi:hypothetical protein
MILSFLQFVSMGDHLVCHVVVITIAFARIKFVSLNDFVDNS